jgi:hypothetical protein
MARIHIDDDDSLPDLADLLKAIKQSPRKKTQPTPRQLVKRSASDSRQLDISDFPKPTSRRIELENEKDGKGTKPRQRVLKKVENNARLASESKEKVRSTIVEDNVDKKTLLGRTPRRIARPKVQELGLSDDEDVKNNAEGKKKGAGRKYQYDSDNTLPSPSKLFSKPRSYAPVFEVTPSQDLKAPSLKLGKFILPSLPPKTTPKEKPLVQKTQPLLHSISRPTSSSDNDRAAFLI